MTKPSSDLHGVEMTWNAFTKAGYEIVVRDGDGEEFFGLDKTQAIAEVTSCDEGWFIVYKETERLGWVYFVFGNLPGEVICDYTVNFDHVIEPLTEGWLD